MQPLLSTINKI